MKDQQTLRIELVVTVVLASIGLVFFGAEVVARAQKIPQTPAEVWLSLSPEARQEYVHGYLLGFERGRRVACDWHDENEALSKTAPIINRKCLKSLPEFTESYYGIYVDTITDYFTRYPHDRKAGPSIILDELAAPPGLTVEQIHQKLSR